MAEVSENGRVMFMEASSPFGAMVINNTFWRRIKSHCKNKILFNVTLLLAHEALGHSSGARAWKVKGNILAKSVKIIFVYLFGR